MSKNKEAMKRAQRKYERNNVRRFTLKLTSVDEDLINYLERKDNVNGYLKMLIRNDKEKGGV